MDRILGGNSALQTNIGSMIDGASNKFEEDWAAFMDICDLVNQTDEGPKDAAKAIKRKLSVCSGKNNAAVLNVLIILETCAKNCGLRFHQQIAKKEFLNELTNVLQPSKTPSTEVQEKVLHLIQGWADSFRNDSSLREVERVYSELRARGIEFPAKRPEDTIVIAAPAIPADSAVATHRHSSASNARWSTSGPGQQPHVQTIDEAAGATIPVLNIGEKLRRDLDVVENNIRIFNEMMSELTPGSENADDRELLVELNRTCHQMQERVIALLGQVEHDEDLLTRLLTVNDSFNSLFLRYERFEKSRPQGDSVSNIPPPAAPARRQHDNDQPPAFDELFKAGALNESPPVVAAPPPPTMQKNGATNGAADLIDWGDGEESDATASIVKPHEASEMEEWLRVEKENEAKANATGDGADDFESYLQSRLSQQQVDPISSSEPIPPPAPPRRDL